MLQRTAAATRARFILLAKARRSVLLTIERNARLACHHNGAVVLPHARAKRVRLKAGSNDVIAPAIARAKQTLQLPNTAE